MSVPCCNDDATASVPPRWFLLLENPRKSNNLGPILRCSAAFGISQIVTVGYDKCSTHGSHGASKHVSMIAFPTVDQAVFYLREKCDCKSFVGLLGGVADAYDCSGYSVAEENEIVSVSLYASNTAATKRSYPIHSRPFVEGNCCFVISKNPTGLSSRLANTCDFFVHVPHMNASENDSSLLDVPSCFSIALHHYTSWAKYDERDFQGHKYEVGVAQQKSLEAQEATRLARAKVRGEASAETVIGAGEIFGDDANAGDY